MRSQSLPLRALLGIAALIPAVNLLAQDVSTTPDIAPGNGEYEGSAAMVYNSGGNTVTLTGFELTGLSAVNGGNNLPGNSVGAMSTEQFSSFFDVFVSINGGPSVETSGSGTLDASITRDSGSGNSGMFDTQITSMDLTGSAGGHTIELMADPNPADPTLGQTTISDLGGGNFQINSFFDVFTELSLDGGPFIEAGTSNKITLDPAPDASSTLILLSLPLLVVVLVHRRVVRNSR